MRNESYNFYSVLKNEDATPFVGNNILIVADGLGGSGSTVHDIEMLKEISLHDEICSCAFFDFDWDKMQGLNGYIEQLLKPMADGISDTSALWASRIAIARCAYALCCDERFMNCDLSDGSIRESLADFIAEGLKSTAINFNLEKGKYDDQKLLPTTLAFIKYKSDKAGKTIAEVVWAGDSRCYALTKDGLKQLSVDDEDMSGSITNLFYVGGKKPTILNYRKYIIDNPCVLLAVSDGVFDPFEPHDNFGVENILLEFVKNSSSYEELMDELQDRYEKIHSDDATMALTAIGFKRYTDMQSAFAKRGKYVADLWQTFCKENSTLEVINQPEEEVRGYVETRTKDKLASIVGQIISFDGDIAFTETVKNIIETNKERLAEEESINKIKRFEVVLEGLEKYLIEHCEEPLADVLGNLDFVSSNYSLKLAIEAALKDYESLIKVMDKKQQAEILKKEKEQWRKVIIEREEYYWQKFNELRGVKSSEKERTRMGISLRAWEQIDVDFEQGFRLGNLNVLEHDDRLIAKNIANFVTQCKEYLTGSSKIEISLNIAKSRYRDSLRELFSLLKKEPCVCAGLFAEDIVEKFGFEFPDSVNGSEVEIGANKIVEILSAEKEAVVQNIVDSLAENYDKTSVIDCNYNATRLNAFREYYRLKNNPNYAIGEFKKELNKLEQGYVNLIKN